ncbi:MAG: transglutaminase family protein [Hyphomicrobium aestuarii]|nr:transglutaminase family protein [Hyphomicrobium aestuarii]
MLRHLVVRHKTEYIYNEPVLFGRHRMMFRPRDSHSLRLIHTKLVINPKPLQILWAFDAFGNSVAFAEFGDVKSSSLTFESEISLHHYETPQPTALLLPMAAAFPFEYPDHELPDLAPLMQLNRPDPDNRLADWARQFVTQGNGVTLDILTAMKRAIRTTFQYQARQASGTHDPVKTLMLKSGSCRDFALLMIEALRTLGFAARFVSGYIYSPNRDHHRGGGATHAWVQVYLPGCGWIDIDPTNGIFGNRDLITVAVSRDHKLAAPLSGHFVGRPSAYRSMTVDVSVSLFDRIHFRPPVET